MSVELSSWQCRFYRLLRFLLLLLAVGAPVGSAIAKFEVASVSTSSVVVRMISAANVSRYEMNVTMFDLDRLREFRRLEFASPRNDDELSFDSLVPSTWFAIRIQYRLIYQASDSSTGSDFATKQELIVRTKNETRATAPTVIDDHIIMIEGVITDERNVNVTVSSAFPSNARISTIIVPELRCERGTVKPSAQRVFGFARIQFDLGKPLHNNNRYENPHCKTLCIFPFIRAEIIDIGQQTFRGREWCGTLQEAMQLIPSSVGTEKRSSVIVLIAIAMTTVLDLVLRL